MKIAIIKKVNYLTILFISIVFLNYGCSDGVSIDNLNLFSISDDVQLGNEVVVEMHKDQANYPISTNTVAINYVQGIMNTIIQSPLVKYRNDFNYQIRIIDNETVNAFALPG